MKKNSLLKKLSGYQKASRSRFNLLANKTLSIKEFVLFEFCVAIADWDSRHKDTYGSFKATNKQIAEILGWKSESSASRHKDSLLDKGFILLKEEGWYLVKGYHAWELRNKDYRLQQEELAEIKASYAKVQEERAETEENRAYEPDYSLVSSKFDFNLVKESDSERYWDLPRPSEILESDIEWWNNHSEMQL